MAPQDSLHRGCVGILRGVRICAWPILAVSLLLAGLAVYYTFTHLVISTSRNDLVASDQRLLKLAGKMDRAFGGRDSLVVVVENGHPQQTTEFADALAAELRRYPDRFPELFYHLDPEQFQRWALLYLDTNDLGQLKDNLVSQKRLVAGLAADPRLTTFYQLVNEQMARSMIGNLFTGFLEEEKGPEPDLALLHASLKELSLSLEGKHPYVSPFNALFPKELSDLKQEGYFFTDNQKFLMFLVTPQPDGYTTSHENVTFLREALARVKARFPGIQAGVTGHTLQADEMSSAMKDVTLATWLSLVGQMVLLIIFLRSLRRPLVEGMVLIIGLCWTFGLITLVVGHLNILSVVFVPLMLGLSIDFGIHWFCRLEEEQGGRVPCSAEALACTMRRSAPGISYAGLAATVSFLPLAFVGFKGLAELGLILTMGILVMLVATLVLTPALVMLSERCTPGGFPEDCPPRPKPFLHLHWTRPGLLVALGAVITVLGAVCLLRVPFDLNPLHLQNPKTESVVWEYKLLEGSKYSTSYGALATASLAELEARSEALKKLPTVSHVESALSFLPSKVEEKRRILAEMEPVLNSVNFAGAPAQPVNPKDLAAILGRINFRDGRSREKSGRTRGGHQKTDGRDPSVYR